MKSKKRKFDPTTSYYEEVGNDFRRIESEHWDSDWKTFKGYLEESKIPSGLLMNMLQSILAKKATSKEELLATRDLLRDNPGVEDYINKRLEKFSV